MEVKQLRPEEFSESRIEAMKEIYGEHWKVEVNKLHDDIVNKIQIVNGKNISKKTELKEAVADVIIEIVKMFYDDPKDWKAPISNAYNKLRGLNND